MQHKIHKSKTWFDCHETKNDITEVNCIDNRKLTKGTDKGLTKDLTSIKDFEFKALKTLQPDLIGFYI